MKNQALLIVLLVIVFLLSWITSRAENPVYLKKMNETLVEMNTAQSVSDYIATANTFERIASVSDTEWLPLYYHAYIYIQLINEDKNATEDQKEEYIAIARESVDKLLISHPKEVEVQVLDAWCWINRIGLRPMVYGMLYIGNYSEAIERAYAVEQNNPRAIFLDLSNKIGKAEFFNSDISEYCEQAHFLFENWDDYARKSDLHPVWGKEGVKYQLSKCD